MFETLWLGERHHGSRIPCGEVTNTVVRGWAKSISETPHGASVVQMRELNLSVNRAILDSLCKAVKLQTLQPCAA